MSGNQFSSTPQDIFLALPEGTNRTLQPQMVLPGTFTQNATVQMANQEFIELASPQLQGMDIQGSLAPTTIQLYVNQGEQNVEQGLSLVNQPVFGQNISVALQQGSGSGHYIETNLPNLNNGSIQGQAIEASPVQMFRPVFTNSPQQNMDNQAVPNVTILTSSANLSPWYKDKNTAMCNNVKSSLPSAVQNVTNVDNNIGSRNSGQKLGSTVGFTSNSTGVDKTSLHLNEQNGNFTTSQTQQQIVVLHCSDAQGQDPNLCTFVTPVSTELENYQSSAVSVSTTLPTMVQTNLAHKRKNITSAKTNSDLASEKQSYVIKKSFLHNKPELVARKEELVSKPKQAHSNMSTNPSSNNLSNQPATNTTNSINVVYPAGLPFHQGALPSNVLSIKSYPQPQVNHHQHDSGQIIVQRTFQPIEKLGASGTNDRVDSAISQQSSADLGQQMVQYVMKNRPKETQSTTSMSKNGACRKVDFVDAVFETRTSGDACNVWNEKINSSNENQYSSESTSDLLSTHRNWKTADVRQSLAGSASRREESPEIARLLSKPLRTISSTDINTSNSVVTAVPSKTIGKINQGVVPSKDSAFTVMVGNRDKDESAGARIPSDLVTHVLANSPEKNSSEAVQIHTVNDPNMLLQLLEQTAKSSTANPTTRINNNGSNVGVIPSESVSDTNIQSSQVSVSQPSHLFTIGGTSNFQNYQSKRTRVSGTYVPPAVVQPLEIGQNINRSVPCERGGTIATGNTHGDSPNVQQVIAIDPELLMKLCQQAVSHPP